VGAVSASLPDLGGLVQSRAPPLLLDRPLAPRQPHRVVVPRLKRGAEEMLDGRSCCRSASVLLASALLCRRAEMSVGLPAWVDARPCSHPSEAHGLSWKKASCEPNSVDSLSGWTVELRAR